MQDINKRFDQIEERLLNIEQKLGLSKPVVQATGQTTASQEAWSSKEEPVSATRLLAWCAGFTFVLAVIHFLKLVYDSGGLTPIRQVGLAYLEAPVPTLALFFYNDRPYT